VTHFKGWGENVYDSMAITASEIHIGCRCYIVEVAGYSCRYIRTRMRNYGLFRTSYARDDPGSANMFDMTSSAIPVRGCFEVAERRRRACVR